MACEIQINAYNQEELSRLADNFYDNNIYQTYAYQKVRAEIDGQDLNSIVIKDNDDIILMFHMRIQKVPIFGIKIGYVQSGPLMLRKDGKLDKLPEALRLVHNLCFEKMINVIRMNPYIRDDEQGRKISRMLEKNDIRKVTHISPYHTMWVSLKETEDEIRARLNYETRRQLKKAEQRDIQLKEGTSDEYFSILINLDAQAKIRKGFKGVDPIIFAKTQKLLLSNEKIRVFVANIDEQPATAHASVYFGKVALALISSNSETALKQGSSYLTWWKAFAQAKSAGMEYYDLGGIDKEQNPNGYLFKKHLGSEEIIHIGSYEVCKNSIIRYMWHSAEWFYNLIK